MGLGKIDRPVEGLNQDKLSVYLQAKGFADFVMQCETPMTIAIQGDWGSGKTSFVNLVMDTLQEDTIGQRTSEDCVFVTFNAWQYSQFGMADQLPTNLLMALTKEIMKDMPKDAEKGRKALEEISRGAKALGKVTVNLLSDYVKAKTDVDVGTHLKKFHGELADKDDKPDAVNTVQSLRKNFQISVEARLGITDKNRAETQNRRLILFVDDLDRLAPERAVEVLELLKIFLDCKYCVFLLAVDYNVVLNGVYVKYKGALNQQKGREYFEKMIQVVYTMPTSLRHTDRYIASILATNKMNRAVAGDFSKLVKAMGRDNPRAIKRLLNSFLLLACMKRYTDKTPDIENDVALFATLCLQHTCQELYDYLLSRLEDFPEDLLYRLKQDVRKEVRSELNESQENDGAQASGLPAEVLRRLGLMDENGKRDLLKYQFLNVFFEQIMECDWSMDAFDSVYYDAEFTATQIKLLRDSLQLTQMTKYGTNIITEDDCVAFVIADHIYCPSKTGTVSEAFAISCDYLLSCADDDELAPLLEKFDFLSMDAAAFSQAHPVKREFSRIVRGAGGEKDTVEVKLDTVYVDLSISANDMVTNLENLMAYFDEQGQSVYLGWAKDKGAREMLWEHREVEGKTPDLSGITFDSLDDDFLNDAAEESSDFDDFGDFGDFEEEE